MAKKKENFTAEDFEAAEKELTKEDYEALIKIHGPVEHFVEALKNLSAVSED